MVPPKALGFCLLAQNSRKLLILSHQVCDHLLWQTKESKYPDCTLSLLSTYGNIIKLVSIIWKCMKLAWGMTGFHAVGDFAGKRHLATSLLS